MDGQDSRLLARLFASERTNGRHFVIHVTSLVRPIISPRHMMRSGKNNTISRRQVHASADVDARYHESGSRGGLGGPVGRRRLPYHGHCFAASSGAIGGIHLTIPVAARATFCENFLLAQANNRPLRANIMDGGVGRDST